MTTDEIMALADKYAESDVDFVLLGDPDPKPFRDALQSAIEALQRDLEHMRIERDEQARQNTLRKEILVTGNEMVRELNAQIEALQADAARYRWLRGRNDSQEVDPPGPYVVQEDRYGNVQFLSATEADEAIDAAMALDKP